MSDVSESKAQPPASQATSWRFYDLPGLAAAYDLWSALTESRATARVVEAADLQPGDSVLEVAVGTGILFSQLAQMRSLRRCIGVEPAEAMMKRARSRLARYQDEHVALCRGDARSIPFARSSFDVVINCYMLDLLTEHDIHDILREFHRVLKSNGRLVLLVMARQRWLVQTIWMSLYALRPTLVGGCRPVPLSGYLNAGGWRTERVEQISQSGFISRLILAKPG